MRGRASPLNMACTRWPPGRAVSATTSCDVVAMATRCRRAMVNGHCTARCWTHPWFKRRLGDGTGAQWSLPDPLLAERMEAFRLSGAMTPIDLSRRAFDDAFLVEARAACIEWPGQLRIDLSSSHPWFVVFDELPDFICIEPQSGPPNGINDGLVAPVTLVAPGQPLELVNEWRDTRGQPEG